MKLKLSYILPSLAVFILFVIACEKDFKADEKPAPPPVVSKSFAEEFDSVGNLSKKGWVIVNNSFPYGPLAWRQGKYELGGKLGNEIVGFPAYSAVYNANEFISVDLTCGEGLATLNAWLITPPMTMKEGDQLTFYTKAKGDYADRLEIRGNFSSESTFVGKGAEEVGDFKDILLVINPALTLSDYPVEWTKYTVTLPKLPGTQIKGRLAFRYYVTEGGPEGANSDMIGVDKLEFISK
jgi:hypothetical protein